LPGAEFEGGRAPSPLRLLAAFLVVVIGLLGLAVTAQAAPAANQRVDLRVLLLSGQGVEPELLAWQDELRRLGVPFDTIVADAAPPITAATLADGTTRAKYQAVILADDLVVLSLAPEERAALQSFELAFGVRQIVTFAFPSAEEGLVYSGAAGPMSTLGSESTLTSDGRGVFPYLQGRVTFEPSAWGFTAQPAGNATITTLVPSADGSSLVAGVRWPDGREEMVSTVSVGPNMIHGSLLLRGMLAWATERVGIGMWRNYYAAHIDDIFLGDDRWDMVNNVTHEDDGATLPIIRMGTSDVTRAVNWSRANGLKLDFVYNGAGMDEAIAENGSDPLSASLLQNKAEFRWINHTYDHLNLDNASQATIVDQIRRNRQFATRVGLSIRNNELVTGEHSGLANPNMPAALTQLNIRWFGSDNSRQPQPYQLGTGTAVPRHPSNIYYNVGTRAEQLDEYNYIYHDACVNTSVTTCLTQPATWEQYVASEASIMLRHLLGNDPRPHYMHQANLAEQGTFYPIVDEVLARYRSYFTTALVNPTMTESGQELTRQVAWASARAQGRVTAYRLGVNVVISNSGSTAIDVPVTGTGTAATYGGVRSRWVSVAPGSSVTLRINTTA
jgi:hypothetical protein